MDAQVCSRRKVGLGTFAVAPSPEVLVAYGLGSCIAVAVVDAGLGLGALAHVMLPAWNEGPGDDNPHKYADRVLEIMIRDLLAGGAARQALVGKIAGGADMFPEIPRDAVGSRNVRAVEEVLVALGIPLLGRDVGGNHGRTVELHTETGRLRVRSFRKREIWL
jgi:chemotaxis protein CheD